MKSYKEGDIITINGEILKAVEKPNMCEKCCLHDTETCGRIACIGVRFDRVGSLWHDPSEVPQNGRLALVQAKDNYPFITGPTNSAWDRTVEDFGITKWAYTDDLFLTDKIR